jgi:putative endonuclease
MESANQWLGRYGEDRALNYLISLGYQILERNWRGKQGEIDLIARDGERLVFIEVKTRSSNDFGHPLEAITSVKLARMRRLVAEWCQVRGVSSVMVRLDALAVIVRGGRVSFEHLKQVS